MDADMPPAKPRLDFRRGRPPSTSSSRKPVPVDDALSRVAGRVAERRRVLDEARSRDPRPDEPF